MPNLFLVFNHRFTPQQENDARISLGVGRIVSLPATLQQRWSDIPPDFPEIGAFLEPFKEWLSSEARDGDYILIQGDFGACYLMVNFALERKLVPIYSTTDRLAIEEQQENGAVKLVHHFQHQAFRKYGR